MYLKSLELFGFKSFPDRTVLKFDRGATVVVGPNGSGKSNISDAMRWVLGEVSSRQIRGTKMEDVIFGGTDDRRQMNFAEVTVTFDNSDRQMDIDFDEVSVTRRYYRKGESEYYINRKAVRLRDIHELFMNTGVGREGYSIIGQGKIAEIISRKSEDRRTIFEEAAGISKYRYKKEEAEHKLASVDDNLTRLRDIMSELEGRVGPLERESEKARKYLEYFEVKKRDDVSLWIYDMDKLSADLKEADDELKLAKNELDIVTEALESLENQNERIFEVSQESKYKYEQLQSEIEAARQTSHELDNKIKLTENDVAHREMQISDKNDAKSKLAERKAQLEEQLNLKKSALDLASGGADSLAADLAALEAKADAARHERDELRVRLDGQLEELKRGEERLVELKIRLSVLDTTEKTDSDKASSLRDELDKYAESTAMLEARANKADKVIADYRQKSEQLTAEISKMAAAVDELKKKKQDLIDVSNETYLEYTAKKHRIDAIRRMEELFEGYAQSVRFVMSEYEAGHIGGTSRISDIDAKGGRIYGPVSRLINVSAKYTLAIETALGANIQNIIVDDEATAKAAIRHLKDKNAGRATFYPISSMKPRYSQIPDAECKRYAGYLGTADTVIEFDEKYSGVIRNLLGATLIFDNIDNGAAMAKATGYKVRVVTLDGQVINAGGSFTGGSAKRDSGMLTRKAETEKLKRDSEALAEKLDSIKKEQTKCDDDIAAKTKEMSALSSQNAMLESLIGAENTQLEVIRSQLGGERSLSASLERDLEAIKTDALERADGIAKLNAETEEIAASNERIAAERSAGADKLGELEELIDDCERERSEMLVRRAEAGKDVELRRYELDEMRARLDENIEQAAENERLAELLAQQNASAADEIESMKAELSELAKSIEQLENERAATSTQNLEYEQKLNQLRTQIKDKMNKRELCFRDHTLAENRQRNLVENRDKHTARLWDEYELTYSTAKECAYPAVTEQTRSAVAAELTEYRNKLRALGSVNLNAIEEYTEVKTRFDFMSEQISDLEKSKDNLLEIIVKLEYEMRETFTAAFAEIDRNFKIVFAELFGGGTAELALTDPENVLTSGIEIRVAPPGKVIKSMTLLSGGEQSFVAIALLFAIIRFSPTPFCIFDEVEAALDDANVFRFADYLHRYASRTQFIVITHRRGTMEIADRIYGVTMQERGISTILPLDIAQAEATLEKESK